MAFSKFLIPAALLAAAGGTALALGSLPAAAQQAGYGQTMGTGQQERELNFGSGPSRSSGGILDSTNPIELMNKLRKGTAMDEATPPGDAIDAALSDYQQRAPGSTASNPGPSSLVKPAQ
jgi:hypothetical protein